MQLVSWLEFPYFIKLVPYMAEQTNFRPQKWNSSVIKLLSCRGSFCLQIIGANADSIAVKFQLYSFQINFTFNKSQSPLP